MPLKVLITKGSRADSKEAIELIDELEMQHLLADRGYDTNKILNYAEENKIKAEIPPKKSRIEPQSYDAHLYKIRHLVENAFNDLKRWRGIATRYCKRESSFLASVQIACMKMWLNIL